MGKALSSLSVSSSSEVEELTAVGEEGVVKGGGEDSLAASGGGIGRARGERQGRGMAAWSKHSRYLSGSSWEQDKKMHQKVG